MHLSSILLAISLLSTQIAVGLPTEDSSGLGSVEVVGSLGQIGIGGSPGNVETGGAVVTTLLHPSLLRVAINKYPQSSVVTPSGTILHKTADNFEYHELPEGMDVSHPGFDIQMLISWLSPARNFPRSLVSQVQALSLRARIIP
ncbi:hypothetical protein BDD12DRAFT_807611 [Trichophaea hybrida]|nr:hypothetical protein BDD12DRAFT_807611 [Trichophaea hybrida]